MKTPSLLAVCLFYSVFAVVNSVNALGLTFTTNTYSTASGPYVTVADVNGDGRLDLITQNSNTNSLTILTNDGRGGFGFFSTLFITNLAGGIGVVPADVNGDGNADLICSSGSVVVVMTNNGSGHFGSNSTCSVLSTSGFCIASDINLDGKPDIICGPYASTGTVSIYTNNGYGIFGSNATYSVGSYTAMICVADVNGDGYKDLITVSYRGNNANTLMVLTNNGKGFFGFNASYTVGKAPVWVCAADINRDGFVDLITANNETNTLTVLTNNGKGIFGMNATIAVGATPLFVTATDLRGSGYLDLVTGNGGTYTTVPGHGNTMTVLTNNGSGGFGSNATLYVGNGVINGFATDLNSDGKQDFICANYYDNTVTVLLNTTLFSSATNFPKLTITRNANFMRVSWPSVSPGWSLQDCPNLARTNWLPSGYEDYSEVYVGATVPIADDGTNKSFNFQEPEGKLFFRLIHP